MRSKCQQPVKCLAGNWLVACADQQEHYSVAVRHNQPIVFFVWRAHARQEGLDRLQGVFVPGNLAPGEYTLIVNVRGYSRPLSSSIPFVVAGG